MGSRLILALAAAIPLAAQSWHVGQSPVQIFAATSRWEARSDVGEYESGFAWQALQARAEAATVKESLTVRPTLRITASHQPVAALRAVSREAPEGTALYSVAVCNLSAAQVQIDARQVEQMIEAHGVAVMPRPMAQATVNRARSKKMRVAMTVLPMIPMFASAALGGGAAGAFRLTPGTISAIGGIGAGSQIAIDAMRPSFDEARADISQHGPWLADERNISLAPKGCSQRYSLMGSYQRGQKRALVIEVE